MGKIILVRQREHEACHTKEYVVDHSEERVGRSYRGYIKGVTQGEYKGRSYRRNMREVHAERNMYCVILEEHAEGDKGRTYRGIKQGEHVE